MNLSVSVKDVTVANLFINAIIKVIQAVNLTDYVVGLMEPNDDVAKLISKVFTVTVLDNLLGYVFVMDYSVKLDLVYLMANVVTLADAH